MAAADYTPDADDIATILRGRLRHAGGSVPATWDTTTNPTLAQVDAVIALQAPLVLVQTGSVEKPDPLQCTGAGTIQAAVKALIAQRVALVIEWGYFAESLADTGRDERNDWDRLKRDLDAVVSAAQECRIGEIVPGGDGPGGEGVAMPAAYGFEIQRQPLSF